MLASAPTMPMTPEKWHSSVRYFVKTPHRLDEGRIADLSQCGAPDDAKEDVSPVHRCGTQERERE
jgi:hypothetical protein